MLTGLLEEFPFPLCASMLLMKFLLLWAMVSLFRMTFLPRFCRPWRASMVEPSCSTLGVRNRSYKRPILKGGMNYHEWNQSGVKCLPPLTFFALSFSARPLKCISTGISKPAYPSSFTTKGSLVSTEK